MLTSSCSPSVPPLLPALPLLVSYSISFLLFSPVFVLILYSCIGLSHGVLFFYFSHGVLFFYFSYFTAAAGGAAPAAEAPKEEKAKVEEVDALEGGMDMFGGGEKGGDY